MALRGNFSRDTVGVARYIGGGALALTRGNTFRAEGFRASILRSGDTEALKGYAVPTGYYPPATWRLPVVSGQMSVHYRINASASLTGAAAGGKNASASLTAVGSLTGDGKLVVSGSASLTASATMTGSILAALNASASLTASATLSGDVDGPGYMSASLNASASLTGQRYAIGYLSANIQPATQLEAAEFAQYVLDQENVETGLSVREALRLMAAALAGEISGAGTTTITIRNAVADDKDRIVATVDGDGNRSAVTYDLTDS
jgi:hypothetical protein